MLGVGCWVVPIGNIAHCRSKIAPNERQTQLEYCSIRQRQWRQKSSVEPSCFPRINLFVTIDATSSGVLIFLRSPTGAVSSQTQEEHMSEHIHHVSDANFKTEVLESGVPVLVDYWAEWCGPCKMIAPILDEVAKEYGSKLKVAKLNIDDNQKTPGEYGVRGIPTLMLFKGGNVEATKVGALSKSQLTAFIDSNL
jgi:thioredoxin 1